MTYKCPRFDTSSEDFKYRLFDEDSSDFQGDEDHNEDDEENLEDGEDDDSNDDEDYGDDVEQY